MEWNENSSGFQGFPSSDGRDADGKQGWKDLLEADDVRSSGRNSMTGLERDARMHSVDIANIQAGEIIDDRYRIIRKLGAGGMGTVFEAEHVVTKGGVAIKLVNCADEDLCRRLLHEAQSLAQIQSRYVVKVFDCKAQSPFWAWFVMELLRGHSLRAILYRLQGALPVERAIRYAIQIAEGVLAGHLLGIVHRDLKPENIFVIEPEDEIKVLDFGMSKSTASNAPQTAPMLVFGTPAYVSPERLIMGRTDYRGDTYSLGIIIYEILVGRHPYALGDGALAFPSPYDVGIKHVYERIVPLHVRNPAIPVHVSNVVARMLAKNVDARMSMAEAVKHLRACLIYIDCVKNHKTVPPKVQVLLEQASHPRPDEDLVEGEKNFAACHGPAVVAQAAAVQAAATQAAATQAAATALFDASGAEAEAENPSFTMPGESEDLLALVSSGTGAERNALGAQGTTGPLASSNPMRVTKPGAQEKAAAPELVKAAFGPPLPLAGTPVFGPSIDRSPEAGPQPFGAPAPKDFGGFLPGALKAPSHVDIVDHGPLMMVTQNLQLLKGEPGAHPKAMVTEPLELARQGALSRLPTNAERMKAPGAAASPAPAPPTTQTAPVVAPTQKKDRHQAPAIPVQQNDEAIGSSSRLERQAFLGAVMLIGGPPSKSQLVAAIWKLCLSRNASLVQLMHDLGTGATFASLNDLPVLRCDLSELADRQDEYPTFGRGLATFASRAMERFYDVTKLETRPPPWLAFGFGLMSLLPEAMIQPGAKQAFYSLGSRSVNQLKVLESVLAVLTVAPVASRPTILECIRMYGEGSPDVQETTRIALENWVASMTTRLPAEEAGRSTDLVPTKQVLTQQVPTLGNLANSRPQPSDFQQRSPMIQARAPAASDDQEVDRSLIQGPTQSPKWALDELPLAENLFANPADLLALKPAKRPWLMRIGAVWQPQSLLEWVRAIVITLFLGAACSAAAISVHETFFPGALRHRMLLRAAAPPAEALQLPGSATPPAVPLGNPTTKVGYEPLLEPAPSGSVIPQARSAGSSSLERAGQ